MPISTTDREFVRQRAQYACEYCGIREADTGNELTIDHFQLRAQGGSGCVPEKGEAAQRPRHRRVDRP